MQSKDIRVGKAVAQQLEQMHSEIKDLRQYKEKAKDCVEVNAACDKSLEKVTGERDTCYGVIESQGALQLARGVEQCTRVNEELEKELQEKVALLEACESKVTEQAAELELGAKHLATCDEAMEMCALSHEECDSELQDKLLVVDAMGKKIKTFQAALTAKNAIIATKTAEVGACEARITSLSAEKDEEPRVDANESTAKLQDCEAALMTQKAEVAVCQDRLTRLSQKAEGEVGDGNAAELPNELEEVMDVVYDFIQDCGKNPNKSHEDEYVPTDMELNFIHVADSVF